MSIQIWKAWSKLNYAPVIDSATDILNQVLWYNDHIRRANKMWFLSLLSINGLNRIPDIYDYPAGRFHTYRYITMKYGPVCDILTHNSIKASIPNFWKNMLKNKVMNENIGTLFERIPKGMKMSKYFYWNLIRKIAVTKKLDFNLSLKHYGRLSYKSNTMMHNGK